MNFKKLLLPLLFVGLQQTVFAQIKLPQLIANSMVLQRDKPLRIWGWASAGEQIKVNFNGKSGKAVADAQGKWTIILPAMKAGGPYQMSLKGKNTIVLKGILIGDVWLCAGQSNMVHQMRLHALRYQKDIDEANFPQIRQFWVPTATNLNGPETALKTSSWKPANPGNVLEFSAVAYFFARDIYRKHGIPIGIINSSVGGTPIEAWISEAGFNNFDAIKASIRQNKDTAYIAKRAKEQAFEYGSYGNDLGLSANPKWYQEDYEPNGWRRINIPGFWEDQGLRNLDGVVWFRKEIDIPAELANKAATLLMGRIVDADVFYINGKQVGSTSYQYPQRVYKVPANLLKAGKNLFVVRVQNNGGKGGFVPDKPYKLDFGGTKIDLKGYWSYKVGQISKPAKRTGERGPVNAQSQPTALYNAMIAPFKNYAIKGVLWYQGESNTGNAREYAKLLPALIADWRQQFRNAALPFYYVQLPNFGDVSYLPSESGTALVREAALKTLSIPNTGMAVTIDLGEWNDIHPDRKQEVGERLALIARHFDYGENQLEYSGPIFQSAEIKGQEIIVHFTHTGLGLQAIDGAPLSDFAIAGEDGKFVWANAKIVGNNVVVSSPDVANPKYVRYAWADSPMNPNLFNKDGLPASPFRTDDF
ncbi:9-O-acetylesterase [Pelobium manganitolerans]|uniref:9-O-acetylesterase n=1 Tax=Pelobium manganitolerans TaxID=1842495 RepID=A0A419S8B2_9SPHI|nr:sialate O-acetylesterase [Pelobium manganitolerans]RKD17993.1 9-O-acetylesterase [Pelobium manganitolerans]